MANIGNQVKSNPFIVDRFSGNGSTTSFSPLTFAPAGTAAIAVHVGGSYQDPSSYSVSGTTLTFNSAPASGTNNIVVLHLGVGATTTTPSDGSVSNVKIYATGTANSSTYLRGDNTWGVVNLNSITGELSVTGNITSSGTGFTKLATGTTAQRPSSNSAGYIRYNTTRGLPEYWDATNSTWIGIGAFTATGGTITSSGSNTIHTFTSSGTFQVLSGTTTAEVLVVAGGGQGGNGSTSGGGGAGGVVYSSGITLSTGSYTCTVGATSSSVSNFGATGNPSSFPGVTTASGGGGGKNATNGYPGAGGSGGGAVYNEPSGGSGTPGQGNPGGGGNASSAPTYYADGGGGGAGAAGSPAPNGSTGGAGGNGVAYTISGSSVTYGGGGGGGGWSRPGADVIGPGAGGTGGGGTGFPANRATGPAMNGTNGLGGGGGSGASVGGLGGSGVIIIKYATQ